MVVVRVQLRWLVSIQAEAVKGEKLGPLSCHGTFFYTLLPLFLFCGSVSLVGGKHPTLSHISGPALWAGSNWTLLCFHSASHDSSSSHDIEHYKYGHFPKRSRKDDTLNNIPLE